jgi:hypothetical protein
VSELEQLALLCQRLGAEEAQAATMAAQLMKRADQLAAERGIERTAALSYLVELVMKGRSGESPQEFPPNPPSSPH